MRINLKTLTSESMNTLYFSEKNNNADHLSSLSNFKSKLVPQKTNTVSKAPQTKAAILYIGLKALLVVGLHALLLFAILRMTGALPSIQLPIQTTLITMTSSVVEQAIVAPIKPEVTKLPALKLQDNIPMPVVQPAPAVLADNAITALVPTTTPTISTSVTPTAIQATANRTASRNEAIAEAQSEAKFDADYLNNPAPVYSLMARRQGESGKVLLLVQVTAEGTAGRVEIQQSCGFPRLDEAALEAVRKWRFVPARRGEQAIAASVIVPLTFKLNG